MKPATARLFVTLVVLFLTVVVRQPLADALFAWTGEEDVVEQVKGLGALMLIRFTQRPLETAPFTPMPHTGLNPYGVNTFLEQEGEEAKIRRSLQMIRDAGFRWIRQEFPWQDIEIHGKGDFEDRRTEPSKPAWLKYDRILELAREYGLEILARLDAPPRWTHGGGYSSSRRARQRVRPRSRT